MLIAIHGGGWRRLDKDGYGNRIASALRTGARLCRDRTELYAFGPGEADLADQSGRPSLGRDVGTHSCRLAGYQSQRSGSDR